MPDQHPEEHLRASASQFDQRFFAIYLPRLGSFDLARLDCMPDFLVISPPKTGTTWLTENLRQRPEIFIPEEKELHYFSAYWRHFDINWYLKFFQGARHLIKGEVSTGYGAMPRIVVQLLYTLNPRLKLIYLMRHPTERAWSHAKHRYKHSYGSAVNHPYPTIPDDGYLEFIGPEVLFHSDYLRDLQCWLSVFPKAQVYVGFYETIRSQPKELLSALFAHLGVHPIADWSRFPTSNVIHPGIEKDISPHIERVLNRLYCQPTRRLAQFLREEFNLELPPSWQNVTGETTAEVEEVGASLSVLQKEYDQYAARAYEPFFNPGVTDPLSVPPLNYKGFRAAFMASQWIALSPSLENIAWWTLDHQTLKDYVTKGECFIGRSFEEIKQSIEQAARQSSLKLIAADYQGFNLVAYRGKVYGLALLLGPIDLPRLDHQTLEAYRARGQCLVADSHEEAKRLVDRLVSSKARSRQE